MAALIETDGHPPDEQPWQAFVETLPVGLAVATFGDEGPGHTVAANPALRVLLRGTSGTPPDFLADRTWVDLEERNRLQAALRESHGVTDMPARLRRADGTVVHVEITASGKSGGNGQPATGDREPGVGNGNRSSAIGSRESGAGKRRSTSSCGTWASGGGARSSRAICTSNCCRPRRWRRSGRRCRASRTS